MAGPSPGFTLGDAFTFAKAHGLKAEAKEIESMAIHHQIGGKRHGPKKGRLVDLFETRGIMDEFAAQYWPARHTELGEQRRQSYLDKKDLNERLLRGEPPDEDTADITESSIADDEAKDAELLIPAESHLRDFIIKNLGKLQFGGSPLRLYTDANGDGREYRTEEVGNIDILAVDGDGNFVVFELKLHRGPDPTLGQLARYMGWVKANLASASAREVRGIIVARSIDDKLRYAASVVPNVSLLEYEIEFKLNRVVSIGAQPNNNDQALPGLSA